MKTYVKQTYKELALKRGGVLADASFDQCVFDGCNLRGGLGPYGVVRNVVAKKCKYKSTSPFDAIVEEATIEDLDSGAAMLSISNCLFKHVVLKGKFGKWFVHPTSHAQMDASAYYAAVDWALDVRDAEFVELDLRGIPSELLRRDPETQVAVRQEDARNVTGWEDLPYKVWRSAIRRMAREGAATAEVLLIPERRSKDLADQLASAKMLHDLGLAR